MFFKRFWSYSNPSFHLEILQCASSLVYYLLSSLSWYGMCFKRFFQENSSYWEYPNNVNLYILLPPKDYSGCPKSKYGPVNRQHSLFKKVDIFFKLSKCCVSETLHVENLSAEIIVTEGAQSLHLEQIIYLSNKQTGCVPLKRLSWQCISYFLKKINATFSTVLL